MKHSETKIKNLAEAIQKESLSFGCGSALFGLTKLLFKKDIESFRRDYSEKISLLMDKLEHATEPEFSQILSEIDILKDESKSGKSGLKFFYVNFFDTSEELGAEANMPLFGARIDPPPSDAVGLWKHIYHISLPLDLLEEIAKDNGQTTERVLAKDKQRKFTAHEMAHEVFKAFAPELESEENARIFAKHLLELRKHYIDGLPGTPQVRLDKEKLKDELELWLSSNNVSDIHKVPLELPSFLETLFNNVDKQLFCLNPLGSE